MSIRDVRLQLLIGPQVTVPAPSALIEALESVEVTSNDRERDGFSLIFTLQKSPAGDYSLLRLGLFRPKSRVRVAVFLGAQRELLIDGVVTTTQLQPAARSGSGQLTVIGEDVSLLMDLEQRRAAHPQQADWQIVTKLVSSYGMSPRVTQRRDTPLRNGRQPSQDGTDLAYIRELARLNGFVFSVEPDNALGPAVAYWGPPHQQGRASLPLVVDQGSATTVESLSFSYNSLGPVEAMVSYLDPETRRVQRATPRDDKQPLSSQPARPLRKVYAHNTAMLSGPRAAARIDAETLSNTEAVQGSGELDVLRYGGVLRARRLVKVCGAGLTFDGLYYVKHVSHALQRGSYRQRFELAREGLGA